MPTAPPQTDIDSVLNRPRVDRIREHRYRLGQSAVFGLPVIALHLFGKRLGGEDADRWVAVLEALLTGWIVYVAGAGLLFEGLLHVMKGRPAGGLLIAIASIGMYVFSLIAICYVPFTGKVGYGPLLFPWCVIVLAGWSIWSWWRLARQK